MEKIKKRLKFKNVINYVDSLIIFWYTIFKSTELLISENNYLSD